MKLHRAIVENNLDPEMVGRVQVRIFGVHTDSDVRDFEGSATENLPWAEVIGGTDFGLVDGVGVSSILRVGTLVWILFEEDDPNRPTVLGVVKGISNGESDLSRVSRGDLSDPSISKKNDNIHGSSSEPSQGASAYSKSQTIRSESGNLIEIDDTPGNVRIQILDANGNYFQMSASQYIEKAIADKLEIVLKNLRNFTDGAIEFNASGNLVIKNDVLIEGKLQVLQDIKTEDTVYDEYSSLRTLRETYDAHHHIGNLGKPTSEAIISDPGDDTPAVTITYA